MVSFYKKNKWLIVILLLAIFLRFFRLDYLELFGDELDAGYQSYSLLQTGKDYKGHWFPVYAQSFSEWRAPGLMYAMIPFIKIFGLNEWGVRFCPAFFGVMSILVFYWLLKEIGVKEVVANLTIFLLAISPWHIQYSRAGFELTLLTTFLFLGTLMLIKAIKQNKNYLILLSSIFYCGAIYTYNTANIFVPLLALGTLFIFKSKKNIVVKLLVYGIIFCLPIIYQIIFGHAADRFGTVSIFNHKDVVAEIESYRNASSNSFLSKVFYNKITVAGKKIFFNYGNALGVNFLFKEGDVTFRHSLHQVGNFFWIELPLLIWGLVIFIKNKKKNDWWLLLLLSIAPIASSLTIDGYNHASRLFLLVFPLSYFIALGWNYINRYLSLLVILVLIFQFGFYQYYYWNFYKNESWRWWHSGYKQAMQFVFDNKNNYERVMIDNTYEPALIRYLFWNKIDPKEVFNIKDKMEEKIDGYNGFYVDKKVCLVDFNGNLKIENIKNNVMYLISQEKNVGGDWDWGKNPPEGIKVLETVRNPLGEPLFYLVSKN